MRCNSLDGPDEADSDARPVVNGEASVAGKVGVHG